MASGPAATVASVTGENFARKRTIIARIGHDDFELPAGHEISVTRDSDGKVNMTSLRWGDHQTVFFAEAQEERDEVIVRLGLPVGSAGYGSAGGPESAGDVMPYRFPDD
jgi:hypothetical protein